MENENNKGIGLNSVDLHYEGTITVKLKHGKRVVKTMTFHNRGRWPLFNFVALAAGGQYEIAESFRPKYIRIFNGGTAGATIPDTEAGIIALLTDANDKTTTAILYNTSPETGYSDTNNTAYVKYKFFIPTTQLIATRNLNLLAVYCQDQKNIKNSPNAYFTVKDATDTTKWGELINATVSESYNLEVVWTMTFKN